MNEIKLLRNNDNRTDSDLEKIDEFYRFLQGDVPENILMSIPPKLSANKAASIIWYLQEHLSVFPDTIAMCTRCKDLFDTRRSGMHVEKNGGNYCNSCMHLYNPNTGRLI